MEKPIRPEPKIVPAAGRPPLVRAKPLGPEDRIAPRRDATTPALGGLRYLAVSREAGSGGEDVAQAVASRLGWGVYDKDRLDDVIQQLLISGTILDTADTPGDWGHESSGSAIDRNLVPHEGYVPQLVQAVAEVSKRGNAVFIGRAAQFILPRDETLAVRIVASEKYRILQITAHTGVAGAAALQSIRAQDEARRRFAQRFFRHDLTDPHEFDLVINVELCGPQRAANLILGALSGRIAPSARAPQ